MAAGVAGGIGGMAWRKEAGIAADKAGGMETAVAAGGAAAGAAAEAAAGGGSWIGLRCGFGLGLG